MPTGDPYCPTHGFMPCSCRQYPYSQYPGYSKPEHNSLQQPLLNSELSFSEEERIAIEAVADVVEDLIDSGLGEDAHWRSLNNGNWISENGTMVAEVPLKMVEFALDHQEEVFKRLAKSERVKNLLLQLLDTFKTDKNEEK